MIECSEQVTDDIELQPYIKGYAEVEIFHSLPLCSYWSLVFLLLFVVWIHDMMTILLELLLMHDCCIRVTAF